MDDFPIEKITISGPNLAAVIQRFSSSLGDVDGLLFGHVTRLPSPDLADDDPSSLPSSSSSSSPLSASITGHLCFGSPMSFYDSLGRVNTRLLSRALSADHGSSLLGWFSGRRQSPLRPSMREYAVSVSLFKTLKTLDERVPSPSSTDLAARSPCIFLLLSTSSTPNLSVHTHEYRAFELRPAAGRCDLVPRSVSVVNVGPAFRGQYGSFSPESAFPWMPLGVERKEEGDEKSLIGLRKQGELDRLAEGFSVDRLRQMMGPVASQYKSELENMYGDMLLKLEGLAGLVEKGSIKVLEQENRNLKLRNKVAGLE